MPFSGKTSAVQFLAQQTNHKLKVINMNQQSDATDLLGGFKPVEMKTILFPLREEFEGLFSMTLPQKKEKFLRYILSEYGKKNWHRLLSLMIGAQDVAVKTLKRELVQVKEDLVKLDEAIDKEEALTAGGIAKTKKISKKGANEATTLEIKREKKTDALLNAKDKNNLLKRWRKLRIKLEQASGHVEKSKSALAFSFIEGALSTSITNGA